MGLWPWQKTPDEAKPPKLGGTRAPDQAIRIDFSRPYDFHFCFYDGTGGDWRVFKDCLLIGYTSPADARDDQENVGDWQHQRWLALRQPDGRTVYVPRDRLQFIEEGRPGGSTAEDVGHSRPSG